ncbi:MAG: InlB B-repeat-containing protein [Treponema sp.]|nr:InlB B-repeat-containing protein [Treponema sp.]MCL2251155.1 InlB B-repeat-containing protein [Treponema sp.]
MKRFYIVQILFSLFIFSCANPLITHIAEPKTVSFETNGGSKIDDQIIYLNYPIQRPGDPSKTDFNFDNWYIDNSTFEQLWNFSSIPKTDITLYANWIPLETDIDNDTTGSGTQDDPFLIWNADDLRAIGRGMYLDLDRPLDAHYKLMADIELPVPSAQMSNWTKIEGVFTGGFDGNGHIIKNMTINVPTDIQANQGMFDIIADSGYVKNLGLADVRISGHSAPELDSGIGGIAGNIAGSNASISNCFVTGEITVFASVESIWTITGGIAGSITEGAKVSNCYTNVVIKGGFASNGYYGSFIGGIAGFNDGIIENCYAKGSVIGFYLIGGIAGAVNDTGIITNCIALNSSVRLTVTQPTQLGRITGDNFGALNGNFAFNNMEIMRASSIKTGIGNAENHIDGLGVSAENIKTQSQWLGANFTFAGSEESPWVWEYGKMPRLWFEETGSNWSSHLIDPVPSVFVSKDGGADEQYFNLSSALDAITAAGDYIVTISEDQMISNRTFAIADTNITFISSGAERKIQYSGSASSSMFTLNTANTSLTLSNNITLNGIESSGTAALISITNGTFRMQSGSKITGLNSMSAGGAVNISGTNARFNMEGGEISGNNTNAAATSTDVNGGVTLRTGFFNMSGGKITGNTHQGSNNADVYIASTAVGAFTLSGNAQIGTLKLNATSASALAFVNICSTFTGSVSKVNLRGNTSTGNDNGFELIMTWWNDKAILTGAQGYSVTGTDANRFTLGLFLSNATSNNTASIMPVFAIGNSGADTGKLILTDNAPVILNNITTGEKVRYLTFYNAINAARTEGTDYLITLNMDQTMRNQPLTAANVNITLTGAGAERTIQYNGTENQTLFTLNANNTSLTLDQNITLKGINNSSANLINVANGKLIMREGSKITGHSTTNASGAVNISGTNAYFVMEGGEIRGNNSSTAATSINANGGVTLGSSGFFTMSGGIIMDNTHGTAAADIYISNNRVDSFTLSGNAQIGTLKLNATGLSIGVSNSSSIAVGSGFTGSVTSLNLVSSNSSDINTVIGYWKDRPILTSAAGHTLTSADIGKIQFKNFFAVNYENTQSINLSHELILEAPNAVLRQK